MSETIKPLVRSGQSAGHIISKYQDDIVSMALYRLRPYEIINTLVRDQGISREDLKVGDLEKFFESETFIKIRQQFAVENTIAIRKISEVSCQCLDTAKERIEIAARQKGRILGMMAKEDLDGSYRKEIRNEIELFLKMLADEDKRVEAIKGIDSQTNSLMNISGIWPSDDPHSSTGEVVQEEPAPMNIEAEVDDVV